MTSEGPAGLLLDGGAGHGYGTFWSGAMSESLVIIRTFGNLLEADDAQVELVRAGVQSLLFTDETPMPGSGSAPGIALAVHMRDVSLAEAALTVKPPLA